LFTLTERGGVLWSVRNARPQNRISFGLADHGDDFVGRELSLFDRRLHAGGVLHVLQLDFGDFNSHYA